MNSTSIVGNWYVSNLAMTLATNSVSNYSSAFFLTIRRSGTFFMLQVQMYRCTTDLV